MPFSATVLGLGLDEGLENALMVGGVDPGAGSIPVSPLPYIQEPGKPEGFFEHQLRGKPDLPMHQERPHRLLTLYYTYITTHTVHS